MENKSKKMLILLGVIVVIVLIIVVAALQGKKAGTQEVQTGQPADTTGAVAGETPMAEAPAPVVNEILKDATIAAPGASAITKDNKVVTLDGQQTVNNVAQTSPLAPSESGPVKKETLAPSVIKLEVSAAGFSPNSFTVKPGAAVSVSITGIDFAHALVFEDPSLAAIGIGVYAKETRVISFNAPEKAGSYIFFCNVGNHRSRGEVGTMIVK
ncbi:MAG: hypothetical protein WC719_03610 [Patescibacteria group bacterium]|jgi:plastocyanin